jgi:hypothetical protein
LLRGQRHVARAATHAAPAVRDRQLSPLNNILGYAQILDRAGDLRTQPA